MLAVLLPGDVVMLEEPTVAGGLFYCVAKRAFDVASSAAALAVLAVPMALIALAVCVGSPGPALFSQERVGLGGRTFELYKFRSMRADAEASGVRWAEEADSRVTPFGRVLRRTHIDELPQLWNVLKGDMSLVGPRPERPSFHKAFEQRIRGWRHRTLVRPGLTGLAQVEGGYELLPREKAMLDLRYISERSLALDARIILRTVRVLVTGEGAR